MGSYENHCFGINAHSFMFQLGHTTRYSQTGFSNDIQVWLEEVDGRGVPGCPFRLSIKPDHPPKKVLFLEGERQSGLIDYRLFLCESLVSSKIINYRPWLKVSLAS